MKIYANIQCPYCGTKINYPLEYLSTGGQEKIITCNFSSDGCNQNFPIKIKTSVGITIGKITY